jgi:hypothetical protein
MRAFMFSLEALITIVIVLLACGVFFYAQTNQLQSTTHTEIKNQAASATSIYFNLNQVNQDPSAETQYCTRINTYNLNVKQLIDKNICGGTR